jgi:hypothetical protein
MPTETTPTRAMARLATHHHRLPRGPLLAALALASLILTGALAPSAGAQSPWLHLTAGSRPAYLHAGAGKPGVPGENEVQEITVPLAEFAGKPEQGGFVGSVGTGASQHLLGEFSTEPLAAEEEFQVLDAPTLQKALEVPYGAGKVLVTEKAEAGLLSFRISSPKTTEPVEVAATFGGAPVAKVITPGTAEVPAVPDGELYMTAENVGDGNLDGAKSTIQLRDVLPPGLKATGVAASKPFKEGDFQAREPLPCTLTENGEGVQTATCTMNEALAPYDQIEMRISVDVQPGAKTGEANRLSVSGGGAAPAALARPVTISSEPVPFGVENYEMALEEEGGAPSTQAGAHPFQLNTTIALNQLRDINPLDLESAKPEVTVPSLAKDLDFKLAPGLIGNPTPIPQCTTAQFFETVEGKENRCPPDTAVGVAVATVHEPATVGTATLTEPIFNLEPRVGEPARFGFYVVIANSPVFIDTSVRTGSDYGVTVSVSNITQTAAFLSSEVTFWGVPGDPRHDSQRGWGCLYQARNVTPHPPCATSEAPHPPPFLSLPTSCARALHSSVQGDSWAAPGAFFDVTGAFEPAAPLAGCNRLQFSPEVKVAPDSQEASKPTGLTVDVHVPQEVNTNAQGLASSNVKSIAVAFPQGVTLNPSAADGLQACSEGQVGLLPGLGEQEELLFTPTLPQAFCPDAAKIGTVKITSPLLPPGQPVEGSLYLATPAPNGEGAKNPFDSLLAMYIIAKDPISGTLVKLPGQASLDPGTGQITATFDNNPQLAFEDAEIHLFGGERAPLASPAHCGTYTTEATFTPWSGTGPVKSSSSFLVTSGPDGSPCPPAALPFAPTLTAGSTNINAGSFSPLTTTIGREDGNQQIQSVSLRMPPGLSGILKGVELCPEAQANAGTCSPNSLIGHTIVSVGLGGDPFSVTGGQVFLTEGYKGAPFGLSILNPAVAGPFDLGNVIVRAKVEVDPHTAALTVSTDESPPYAIPHILDGIPLQIKHVNVLIDRPGFTFNPTSCAPQSIGATIKSAEGATASVQTPFQATNCASLKFAPKFSVSTAGKTSKANGASLSVKLTYPSAPAGTYANLAKVKVSLPKQLPSRLTTLQKACTAAAFEANPASCPKESVVGQAKVITPLLPVPLTGPAYFVSHGGEAFPDLTIVLKGYGVTVDLIGNTAIKNGVTTSTFKATPDVPFSSFELNLPQGKFSALAANANLCKSKLTMPSEFIAQNGAELHQQTKISVTGCPKPPSKAQQLQKALRACKKKHAKAKRKSCEAQARRKFAPAKKAKQKKGKGARKR